MIQVVPGRPSRPTLTNTLLSEIIIDRHCPKKSWDRTNMSKLFAIWRFRLLVRLAAVLALASVPYGHAEPMQAISGLDGYR